MTAQGATKTIPATAGQMIRRTQFTSAYGAGELNNSLRRVATFIRARSSEASRVGGGTLKISGDH